MAKRIRNWSAAMTCLTLAACTAVQHPPVPPTGDNSLATIPQAELRDVLTELANAHEQKTQLAILMTLPLVGAQSPYKEFFSTMSTLQRALAEELRTWAAAHHMDLTYHHGTDTMGRAEKIMEDRQGRAIESDGRVDRERDALMQIYTDYEYRVSMLQALLPTVRDAQLKAYLEKSLKVHEEGSSQLVDLLRRFKPS